MVVWDSAIEVMRPGFNVLVLVLAVDALPRLEPLFFVMKSAFAFIGVAVATVVGAFRPFSLAIGICSKTGFAPAAANLVGSIDGTGGVAQGLLAVLLLDTLTSDGFALRTAVGMALSWWKTVEA